MTATYRLQMHAGFTFADAEEQVGYLADLGVSHLYLSPVLQAVPGSMHGYDVLDHSRVSLELGGYDGLAALAASAREAGLGIVVDVVPNHMALVAPESSNRPLWDVLTHGREAAHAHWFDVDWDALDQRIGLPVLGRPLAEAVAEGELTLDGQVIRYYEHVFPIAPGSGGGGVSAVLERQHYVLADWREKDAVLNYRRFFDIDSLIAVRVEHRDVFEATHRLLLDLNHRGLVEGFRIDHPDGLADPGTYLRMLRDSCRPGTAIWVEKILEGVEPLPAWACDGTTGYDAARAVSAALVDPATAPVLQQAWERAGGDPSLAHTLAQAKRLVVDEVLVPERTRLLRRAGQALPGADADRLAAAVTELLVACEVYRAYVRPPEPADALARERMSHALGIASAARPDLEDELQQLVDLVLEPRDDAAHDFAIRLQQTWGPVMAKGIEDTSFYRWHRLVALNEVGGDPELLDHGSPEVLHAWADHQQEHWPLGMTALSTHDTKRSEDVRARLLALAGDADAWARLSADWHDAARRRRVDVPTAHLVWQTLAGAGGIEDERLSGYLVKALREAKLHTSWLSPDEDYEQRVVALAREAEPPVLDAHQVRALVLGQKLLQLTLPGVPDTYQGCETVNLSLVDPDNRRPVDFARLRDRLAHVQRQPPRDLDDEKLLVTHRALRLRREVPAAFGDQGTYEPLRSGTEHLVGFVRGGQVATLVTRAPHRLAQAGGWRDEGVVLPPGAWRNELTGTVHGDADRLLADVLGDWPVALLRKQPAS